MTTESLKQQTTENGALSSLYDAWGMTRKAMGMQPALESADELLDAIRKSMADKPEYIELEQSCVVVREVLNRETNRKQDDPLGQSAFEVIGELTATVDEIKRNIEKQGSKRRFISRALRPKEEKEAIAAWRLNLNRILCALESEFGPSKPVFTPDFRREAAEPPITTPDVHPRNSSAGTVTPTTSHDISDPRTATSQVPVDVAKVGALVRETYRNATKRIDGSRNPGRSVSPISAPSASEWQPITAQTHVSVPGDGSTPPLRNATADIHHHVENTPTIADTREIINGMSQGINRNAGGRPQAVSDSHPSDAPERTLAKVQAPESSVPGESPPPPPKIFGRDELVKKIVDLADADHPAPIALIGTGGIGKTSVALAVLHDDRIKKRFGDHRRLLHCGQFPASLPNFLRRLSQVIGAGIPNPADLNSLRPFLSRNRMFIVIDNAESNFGGSTTEDIGLAVEELSQFRNICLCITSRTLVVPTRCRVIDVPTLSMEAARETFHSIYRRSGQQFGVVDDILKQLDFHPLSVILLATAAKHNRWDTGQLERKWEEQRTGVLRTRFHGSLEATIEFSLHSPMFLDLGPHARDLLGVVAFFPQGVDENNLDWLFPSIVDREKIFNRFCVLSLTHRDKRFITMLAPLRDHLFPKDPISASLLCSVKEHYFTRLSFSTRSHMSDNDDEKAWIASEDVNVEHLLDIFTSIDANSESVWDACEHFTKLLFAHKIRLPVFGPKILALPDDYPSKPRCLDGLSSLCHGVGNSAEQRRLLCHTLKLHRERGNSRGVASTLKSLASLGPKPDHCEERIQQAREAMSIYQRLGAVIEAVDCQADLAYLFRCANRLEDAEKCEGQAIALIDALMPAVDSTLRGALHGILGHIHSHRGETEKAFSHFQASIGGMPIRAYQFVVHCHLGMCCVSEGRFDDAGAHLEHAESLASSDSSDMSHLMVLRARLLLGQGKFEEARSKALHALDLVEEFGGADAERVKDLLHSIEEEMVSWESLCETQGSMARWIERRMIHAALGGDISQDEKIHKATTKLMTLLEKDGNRPGGPHFFQIRTANNELAALIDRSMETRGKSPTVDEPDEIPPPESLMRQDNRPAVIWTTDPKLEHVGQLWQALYHVPQVRHRISQYRSPRLPEGETKVGVDPSSGGTGGHALSTRELFRHMEISGLAVAADKSLMERLPHRPWEGISPCEDVEKAYEEFSEQVEISLNDGLATRNPDWPRLLHSRINNAASQGRSAFNARKDFPLISLGYDDGDGSSDLMGCLKNQVFPEFPEQETLGTNHTTTKGCVTMEAADVIAFALERDESPPSASTVGSQQRRKFSFPESFHLDQFVMVSRPHVQNANVAEREILRETGSDLARKMDIMGSMLSSLHHYENVARSPTDVERHATIESSAAKLKNVIAHIDAEWNGIGATVEQLKNESQSKQAQQNKYDLRAVLMHDGQQGRKHIYSYINHEGAWWKVVGYTVTKVSLETVLSDENGMDVGAGPFFLIYSRSLSEPLKSEWPETLENVYNSNPTPSGSKPRTPTEGS